MRALLTVWKSQSTLFVPRGSACYKRLRQTEYHLKGIPQVIMATNKKGGAQKKAPAAATAAAVTKNKRMSQTEVLTHFAARFELKRAEVKEFFEELASLAAKEVKRNEEFALPGFGKLVLAKRKAREGRNPQTGETIKIAAKTTLKFRLGKAMKDTVVPAKKK